MEREQGRVHDVRTVEHGPVAAIRDHEKPRVGELAEERDRLGYGHERVAVPAYDEHRRRDTTEGWERDGQLRTDLADKGGEQPAPSAGSLDGIVAPLELRGPGRLLALDALGIEEHPRDAGSRLAFDRDTDEDERGQPFGELRGEAHRGHAAKAEAGKVERGESVHILVFQH